ncbi:MAG: glycosyltransferase family 4 protein [Sandaracinaceae bacterium]|nr:glycosyltransferase family 4 protein [Sandaracinaceae bacterium]
MRIGFLTSSYPRYPDDHAGCFVRSLGRSLVARGHLVEVIAPLDPDLGFHLHDRGIEVFPVPCARDGNESAFYGGGVLHNLQSDWRRWRSAWRFLSGALAVLNERQRRWDAVVTHWAFPLGGLAALVGGPKARLAIWHSADVWLALRLLGPKAWFLVRHWAHLHVFVAVHLAKRLGALGDKRTRVIPMGIDVPAPDALPAPPPPRPFRALVLSRLVPIKDIDFAISACVRAQVPITIAGEGPERARLEAAWAGVPSIHWLGAISPQNLPKLFFEHDLLLLTSRFDPKGPWEGCPLAPREAIAHGVPVLATDTPPHRELAARFGPAFMLAPPCEFASKLCELARSPERLRSLAFEARHAIEQESWPSIAQRFESCLAQASDFSLGDGIKLGPVRLPI